MISSTILMLKPEPLSLSYRVYPFHILSLVYQMIRSTPVGRQYHDSPLSSFSVKAIHQDPGGQLSIQFIFLDYRVHLAFYRSLESKSVLRLGSMRYSVAGVAVHPSEHPDAGIVSYESFQLQPAQEKLKMDFKYTAFHRRNQSMVLPVPLNIISSLLTKWNMVSNAVVPAELAEQLAAGMLITSHKLYTELYTIGPRMIFTTFSGGMVVKNVHTDEGLRAILNQLLHFAHYSGVGWKCSYGMGRVNITPMTAPIRKSMLGEVSQV